MNAVRRKNCEIETKASHIDPDSHSKTLFESHLERKHMKRFIILQWMEQTAEHLGPNPRKKRDKDYGASKVLHIGLAESKAENCHQVKATST